MDASIRSFRVQRPFLADFSDLSRRLTPATAVLPRALPRLSTALAVGTPVVRSSVRMNRAYADAFDAVGDLVAEPNTRLALFDLRDLISVLDPLVNYAAPYQTVCNHSVYFFTGLQGDVGFRTQNGSAQAALLKQDQETEQTNTMNQLTDRPVDVPSNVDPRGDFPQPNRPPWQVHHTQAYPPAIDAQGNADCQAGQEGFLTGPLNGPLNRADLDPEEGPAPVSDPNSPEAINEWEAHKGGASHTVAQFNTPGLLGPTFTGVPHVSDVP